VSGTGITAGTEKRKPGDDAIPQPDGVSTDGSLDVRPPSATVSAEEPAPPVSLGSKLFRPHTVVSFLVAIAIVAFFVRRLNIDPHAVWQNIRHANLGLYAIAIGLYYVSFFARAIRWRWMLNQAGLSEADGYPIPDNRGLTEILFLSWFVNCVVPAKLGDGYRCYLLKRRSGAPISRSLGTIFAERLTDLAVLFTMMAVAGVIAFRGHLPGQATRTITIGSALLAAAAIGVVALWFGRHVIERNLPERIRSQFAQLHDSIFACLRRPWRPIAISVLIWSFDGLRLYFVAAALHGDVSFPVAIFVSLMSALLTILPITPAGLGVVELAMVTVFKIVGVDPSLAGSIALMDRLITYWSIVVIGLILYVRRFRSDVR
jgi:uncharacterized protein (TIRG00374 family)